MNSMDCSMRGTMSFARQMFNLGTVPTQIEKSLTCKINTKDLDVTMKLFGQK